MIKELNNCDWAEAFAYAGGDGIGDPCIDAVMGDTEVSLSPFSRDDVVEIIGMSEGDYDGPDWLGVFRLQDGRFAFLEAGCDYTGWGCQAGGSACVSVSLSQLLQFGVGEDQLKRMGLSRE